MTMKHRFPAGDIPVSEFTSEQLYARIAHAHLFLIEMESVSASGGGQALLLEEQLLRYLYKLEIEGRLYGFGPVETTKIRPGYDLAIVAAGSLEEAEKIAAAEPLAKAGLRHNQVRTHMINEGVACYMARALAHRAKKSGDSFDPDISGVTLSRKEMLDRAAGARLHLVHLTSTTKPRPEEDFQSGINHFIWLRDNEMKATLMSCGPVDWSQPLTAGIWGSGMGVFATSAEETEAIAAIEPSGQMGYRRLSVVPWTLNFGLAAPVGKALGALSRLPQ